MKAAIIKDRITAILLNLKAKSIKGRTRKTVNFRRNIPDNRDKCYEPLVKNVLSEKPSTTAKTTKIDFVDVMQVCDICRKKNET